MRKLLTIFICIFLNVSTTTSQSTSGFIVNSNFSIGDLVDGERNPRIVRTITSLNFQLNYNLVNWDHTVFSMGIGYHNLRERDSSLDYLIFPIVFERFIKKNKRGFYTGLALYPSFTLGDNPSFYNSRPVSFNIQVEVRVGTTFNYGFHKFNLSVCLMSPLSNMRNSIPLKYITYGLRFGYYI